MKQLFTVTFRNGYVFKRVFGVEEGSIQAPKISVACTDGAASLFKEPSFTGLKCTQKT